jgi:Cyclin-dependent kinase inhibitor 3 (CDKN3)
VTRWPRGRSLHGGVDEVPLPPPSSGRLWLCGKRYVGPDPEGAVQRVGADAIVCLCERDELVERYPAYVEWLRANEGGRALWWPVPDLHAPDLDQALPMWGELRARVDGGEGLLLHCGAGIGRAGTVAAGLLVLMGVTPDRAVSHVAAHRPMAGPEVGAQSSLLRDLAAHLHGERPVADGT